MVLLLGSCRKYYPTRCIEHPDCDTERVVSCLEQGGYRVSDGKGCAAWRRKEAALITFATAINVKVATDHYGLNIVSVISFAEVW